MTSEIEMQLAIQAIIDDLYTCGIPVNDRMAMQLPNEYWFAVQDAIFNYEAMDLQYTTFKRLYELAKDCDYGPEFLAEMRTYLHFPVFKIDDVYNRLADLDGLREINILLEEFLSNHKLRFHVDMIKQRENARLSMAKRRITRDYFKMYDENLTVDGFISETFNDYPELMIDRIQLSIFSPEYMSYKGKVQKIIKDNKFEFSIEIERAKYTRQELEAEDSYSKEEIDMYCPVNLDEKFSFIENRSVLSDVDLTSKPRKIRDGMGWSYVWAEDGAKYRFKFDPGRSGAPVGLMIQANMQRLVWRRILEHHPELEKQYEDEYYKESNFIPLGLESYYQKYEQVVFKEFREKSLKVYFTMMERSEFYDAKHNPPTVKVSQVELAWNEKLPINPAHKLWLTYRSFEQHGLDVKLDSGSPLFACNYYSDFDTSVKRWAYKKYKKSKNVLRNEVQFYDELENEICIGEGEKRISEHFKGDISHIKKYLYYKFYRRNQQIQGVSGFDHGFFSWRNADLTVSDDIKSIRLQELLNSYDDLPDWIRDITLFDNLVDQEDVSRKFFRNLTEKEYRIRVRESGLFVKKSHGKWRLLHPAVKEYRKLRDQLSHYDFNDFVKIEKTGGD